MTALVVAVAAVAGYLAGRLRPWGWLGDWAKGQMRSSGSWYCGSKLRQTVLLLALAVTAPRETLRALRHRKDDPEPPVVYSPNWVARSDTPGA
ncbi:hypothetical protein OG455_41610 [Kitasatospora sp. NBC_01287]|uniref:hypothetical protein n=1 Tax=Kitasatospora sp. NBC_01287 TaxID=2903573 RepID=UPI00224C91BF|nr:hypothetical protein [Kitasatospora sp. NBC_01287]MCX4750982.1 hypothetical protein [Kitasatospora sp. NBC_01287]MCX4751767.1 hypothetical protein [Kitasatospora sp. NBC_01287]MCX4751941.1 hypothetical protein [Kitasatospora sp. NBC_01287]